MAEASHQQVLKSVKGFLESGAYSDLVITCGSDTYKVHKVIVCGRADFFARALKFGGKETEESTVDLPEDEPAVIKLLIQYLYEGEYDPVLPVSGTLGSAPTTLGTGWRPLKNKYGQPYTYAFPHTCHYQGECGQPLICPHHTCDRPGWGEIAVCGSQCQQFNCPECNRPPLPALNGTSKQLQIHAKMYEMADKYDVHFWDSTEFSITAHYAFLTTPEDDKGLRQVISATISAHMELVEKAEVKVLMTQFNGLALGILQEKIKEHGWGKKKK